MADDSIDISVDPDVSLIKHGNLYKTTVGITVGAEEPYGFNISMQAADSSLSNSIDKSHKITSTQSDTPVELGANQWGYALDSNAGKFSKIPSSSDTNIVDVTKDNLSGCKSVKFCTKRVTYAANIDAAKLSAGNYSTSITYTATAKAAPAPVPTPPVRPSSSASVCASGHSNNCKVDLYDNMIPVKYRNNSIIALANPETLQSDWYDYSVGHWANAVTVSKDALSKYKGQTRVVEKRDILGYWVYIPRYAYNVLRRDGTDSPVSQQNFQIMFEKATDPKHYPAACDRTGQYYQSCVHNHAYDRNAFSNNTTWATHPAFTVNGREVDGIWFSKHTLGFQSGEPMLLDKCNNSDYYHKCYYEDDHTTYDYDYSRYFDKIRYIASDHNLPKSIYSYEANNSDWGAMVYLEYSKYTSRENSGVNNYNKGVHSVNAIANFPMDYSDSHYNNYKISSVESCTFAECGGQALHETSGWGGYIVDLSPAETVVGGMSRVNGLCRFNGLGGAMCAKTQRAYVVLI